jgi:hypothetical protein
MAFMIKAQPLGKPKGYFYIKKRLQWYHIFVKLWARQVMVAPGCETLFRVRPCGTKKMLSGLAGRRQNKLLGFPQTNMPHYFTLIVLNFQSPFITAIFLLIK